MRTGSPRSLISFGLLSILAACGSEPPATDFEFVRHQILVPVAVNGQGPYPMILDTGADPSAIDSQTAEQAGVEVDRSKVGEASGAGEGAALSISPARIQTLEIAGQEIRDLTALSADLRPFAEVLQRPLAGILGISFLQGRRVEIDYPARTLRLLGPRDPVRSGYTVPLRFLPGDTIPLLTVTVAGRPVPVSLDTGSSQGLALFEGALGSRNLEIDPAWLAGESEGLGARGRTSSRLGTLPTLTMGPYTLADVPMSLTESNRAETDRVGNLGNRVLQNFVVTLDYVSLKIHFFLEPADR